MGTKTPFNKIARLLNIVVVVMLIVSVLQVTAFADEARTAFETNYKAQISRIYDFISNLTLPIATVGFATSCVACLFGNRRDIEKASRHILYILIAIVCINLVPLVASAAISIFKDFTYNPPTTFDPNRNITF